MGLFSSPLLVAEKILLDALNGNDELKKNRELDSYYYLYESERDNEWMEDISLKGAYTDKQRFQENRTVLRRAFPEVNITDIKGLQYSNDKGVIKAPPYSGKMKVVYKTSSELEEDLLDLLTKIDQANNMGSLFPHEVFNLQVMATNVFCHYYNEMIRRYTGKAKDKGAEEKQMEREYDITRDRYRNGSDLKDSENFALLSSSANHLVEYRKTYINEVLSIFGDDIYSSENKEISVTNRKNVIQSDTMGTK